MPEDTNLICKADMLIKGQDIANIIHSYMFKPPRPLAEIEAELKDFTDRSLTMIQGLTK